MLRFTLLLALAASGSHALGQPDWEEVGAGSATPPGLIRYEFLDQTVDPNGWADARPEAAIVGEIQPLVAFNSIRTETELGETLTRAALYDPVTGWQLQAGGGLVFPGVRTWPETAPVLATAPGGLLGAAARGVIGMGFLGDAYYGELGPAGWEGRAGSLETGGITDSPAFADQVHDLSLAFDADGIPHVVYTAGSEASRSVFLRRLDGSQWTGVGGSDATPIAAPPQGGTLLHPAIGFIAGTVPVVGFTERVGVIEKVRLWRFNPGTGMWVSFDGDTIEGRRPQIAGTPDGSDVYIATETQFAGPLRVYRWRGSGIPSDFGDPMAPWGLTQIAPLDELRTTDPDPPVASVAMAVDSQGLPVVVFRAASPNPPPTYHLYASYRNLAGQWVALGPVDNTVGISAITYDTAGQDSPPLGHFNPSVAIGFDNRPLVAWEFDNGVTPDPAILVRRYNAPTTNVVAPETAIRQLALILLGEITPGAPFLEALDDNNDQLLDAGDLERLASRL